MPRTSQIRVLSWTARLNDPVVSVMGFPPLWEAVAECAAPKHGALCLDVCTGTGGVSLAMRAAAVHREAEAHAS